MFIRTRFLAHQSTFGNTKYMMKIGGIIYIIISVVTFISMILSRDKAGSSLKTVIMLSIVSAPVIGILVLGFRIRKFKDDFCIIKEFNVLSAYLVIFIITYIIIGGFVPAIFGVTAYVRNLLVITHSTISMIFFYYFQTSYVLKLVQSGKSLASIGTINGTHSLFDSSNGNGNVNSNGGRTEITTTPTPTRSFKQPLSDALKTMDGFEDFMQHLSREWSMEILLALVEMIQFQNYVKTCYPELVDDVKYTALQKTILENDAIPESFIVCNTDVTEVTALYCNEMMKFVENDTMTELKIRAYALYAKYIDGDELEINISYEQRQKLFTLMDNLKYFIQNVKITEIEMCNLYGDIIHELSTLLHYSYNRYTAA